MASGKKNYFRHSFFARNDIKLKLLRDQVGVGFYFFYFSLLEQCGEASSDELKDKYVFHDSTIRNLWCINLKKSEHVASVMNAVGLLEFKKVENTFEFEIPKLAKYLGKYESKSTSNTPNKRKEKEIKVNESKEEVVIEVKGKKAKTKKTTPLFQVEPLQAEEDAHADQDAIFVLTMLNSICFRNFRPTEFNLKFINARLKEKYSREDFKKVIEYKNTEWSVKPEMKEYLQPSTLFGNKFDQYLNQALGSETLSRGEEDALIAQYFPGA